MERFECFNDRGDELIALYIETGFVRTLVVAVIGPDANDEWAAYIGGTSAEGSLRRSVYLVADHGHKLTEIQACSFFDWIDRPYRP